MNHPLREIDREALRSQFSKAEPFPFFSIDGLLDPAFAHEVAAAYPSYESARRMGQEFDAVNEKLKIQVTDQSKFPTPVKRLADALASPEFLSDLEYITGIPNLIADPQLAGGGMHLSGRHGRLDVHVDFNYIEERALHRRLNILVYLNPDWETSWGGAVELWNADVSRCVQSFSPEFNRCVVFETSNISYHGVTPVTCPPDRLRRSFAAYYYTAEPPPAWDGKAHSTIFRARPDEKLRRHVLMPASFLRQRVRTAIWQTRIRVKRYLGMDKKS